MKIFKAHTLLIPRARERAARGIRRRGCENRDDARREKGNAARTEGIFKFRSRLRESRCVSFFFFFLKRVVVVVMLLVVVGFEYASGGRFLEYFSVEYWNTIFVVRRKAFCRK